MPSSAVRNRLSESPPAGSTMGQVSGATRAGSTAGPEPPGRSAPRIADHGALAAEVKRAVLAGDRRGDHVTRLEIGGVALLAGEEGPPLQRRAQEQVAHLGHDRRRRLERGPARRAREEQVARVEPLEAASSDRAAAGPVITSATVPSWRRSPLTHSRSPGNRAK